MKVKNSLKVLITGFISLQLLSGCGGNGNSLLTPEITTPVVSSQSFGGVYNEIEMGIMEAYYMLDEDEDGSISPKEFGVDSPNKIVTFREADLNRDGKITMMEMMPDEMVKLSMAQKMKMTANSIYSRLDLKPKDNKVTSAELGSAVVSKLFSDFFLDYDTEKSTKGYLSKSEFQNLFAYIASSNFPNNMGEADIMPVAGAPKPANPVKVKKPAKRKKI